MKVPRPIAKHGLEDTILQLREKGMGYRMISLTIKQRYGIDVSHMTIKKFLDDNQEQMLEYVAQTMPEQKSKAERWFKKTVKTIDKLNKDLLKDHQDIKKLVNRMKSEGKFDPQLFSSYITNINQIQKQLEFAMKLFGTIKNTPETKITENKTMIINKAMDLNEAIEKLQSLGLIAGTEKDVVSFLRGKGYYITNDEETIKRIKAVIDPTYEQKN